MSAGFRGRLVYLAGNDGTGKTTQAERLVSLFRSEGQPARYVWLRFPQYVSLPVLALSRLLGVTRYQVEAGRRVGRWEFDRARWLAHLLLWCQAVDSRIARARLIDPALRRGEVVVLDRFVYDIVVDIAAAASDPGLLSSLPARLLYGVVDPASAVVLSAPEDIVRARRPDLAVDPALGARAALYRQLAARLGLRTVDAALSVDRVGQLLAAMRSGEQPIATGAAA
jgi:thymidylate kinase